MERNSERVTRADVAKAAGVSETIVSYVVNNNRYCLLYTSDAADD